MNGAYTLSVARSGYLTRTLDELVVTAGAAPLEQAVKLEANSGLLRVGCADKGSRMTLKDAGGRTVLEALVERNGFDTAEVDDVIMGCGAGSGDSVHEGETLVTGQGARAELVFVYASSMAIWKPRPR